MTTKLTIPGGETAPAQTPDTKPAITAKSEILLRHSPPLVAVRKARHEYGLPISTLYRLAAQDLIRIRKIGRSSYVETESVMRLIAELPIAKIGPGSAK
ncbi:MAG: hypothetical protein LW713_07300 [Acetobacteraceae bacterium]|jgi:hypothetical protein|nr:hypothetical protein [Acetobacteraceae bacterium]